MQHPKHYKKGVLPDVMEHMLYTRTEAAYQYWHQQNALTTFGQALKAYSARKWLLRPAK